MPRLYAKTRAQTLGQARRAVNPTSDRLLAGCAHMIGTWSAGCRHWRIASQAQARSAPESTAQRPATNFATDLCGGLNRSKGRVTLNGQTRRYPIKFQHRRVGCGYAEDSPIDSVGAHHQSVRNFNRYQHSRAHGSLLTWMDFF